MSRRRRAEGELRGRLAGASATRPSVLVAVAGPPGPQGRAVGGEACGAHGFAGGEDMGTQAGTAPASAVAAEMFKEDACNRPSSGEELFPKLRVLKVSGQTGSKSEFP